MADVLCFDRCYIVYSICECRNVWEILGQIDVRCLGSFRAVGNVDQAWQSEVIGVTVWRGKVEMVRRLIRKMGWPVVDGEGYEIVA